MSNLPANTLLIVDFLNVAYRGFHAIPHLSNAKGIPTNAVYGFLQIVRKWIQDVKPTHLAILLDAEKPKRRTDLLPDYKAHRPPMPDLLPPQLETLEKLFPLLGWSVFMDPEEEADDLGGALAVKAAAEGFEVRIGSNDKDFLQIVDGRIKVLRSTPKETILVDSGWVQARWGIRPDQVADFLSLLGDSVDNIPGVPGIGEKTASQLIQKYGSIDELISQLETVQREKIRLALQEHSSNLRINQQVIRLNTLCKTPALDHFMIKPPKYDSLLGVLTDLNFKSMAATYRSLQEQSGEVVDGQGTLSF
jgi:DNA polymerase I